jgi:hypothetical protein
MPAFSLPAGPERGLKAVIDDLLAGGDLCRMICAQSAGPTEYLGLERPWWSKGRIYKGLLKPIAIIAPP